MTPLRVVIVDDEQRARQGIRALLARDPDVVVTAECPTGRAAIEAIGRDAPDLVFLDVQMPDQSGFDVLERIDLARLPAIVFVTAYDQYALRAFDANAVDYLLKPFSDARFAEALERAKERCRTRDGQPFRDTVLATLADYRGFDAAGPLRRFFVRTGTHVELIMADAVSWIEAAGYHVKLHTTGRSHLLRGHLGRFERQLDPADFCRISRSAIVNIKHVDRLKDWYQSDDGLVVLRDGTELSASRAHRKRLEALLQRAR